MELVTTQAIKKAKLQPISGKVSVRLVQYAPSLHERDPDGLYPMMKACTDALVKRGILVNDSNRYVHESICGPILIDRDNPRFELVILELEGRSTLPGD